MIITRTLTPAGVTILTITGDLDHATATRFRTEALAAARTGPLVIDLAGCGYWDSLGLAAATGAWVVARDAGHGFALAGLTERMEQPLRVTGLTHVIPAYPDAATAAAALAPEPEPPAPPGLTITMHGYRTLVPVDADGTPLLHGERMTETEPGVWQHPDAIALTECLKGIPAPSADLNEAADLIGDPS